MFTIGEREDSSPGVVTGKMEDLTSNHHNPSTIHHDKKPDHKSDRKPDHRLHDLDEIKVASSSHVVTVPGPGPGIQVMISRAPFTQAAFDEIHLKKVKDDQKGCCDKLREKVYCSKKRMWRFLTSYFPVIKFIQYYKFRENAISDVLAGLSVGTLHIPQALAFGQLASAKIENGLFTSLWPVLIYVFFGTSAHVSMGTSAVICILTAATVDRIGAQWVQDKPWILEQRGNNTVLDDIPEYLDFKEELALGITLVTGIIMIVMGILKLGFITLYLSDSFFAAFTSAAAIHIGVSQLPPMLGIKIKRFGGVFKIVKSLEAIFDEIENSNFAAIIASIICCAIIWFVKEAINERFKKKMPAPIPIELFIVIFGTIASYFGNFRERYNMAVVGEIPLGIPAPVVPVTGLKYTNEYMVDCFVLAILIFAYTIAMAKIMAKKHNYEVNDSQEMLAYGMCNLGSSFLKCIPSCVAPPRTMVASTMNAKTTLNGLFSSALMLLIIVVVAQLFTELPKGVLAAIIFIALKNLFLQIRDFVKYWRINRFDFVIWFFTFFSTVFLDIDVGLGVGVGISILSVVFQTQFAQGYKVGYTKRDPTLVHHNKYKDSSEVPGVKVFRYESSLYFANAEIFRDTLYRTTVNPRKLLKALKKRDKRLKKINAQRAAEGMAPQVDTNFITTGGGLANKSFHNSAPDLTASDSHSAAPLSSMEENRHLHISNPELTAHPAENGTDLTAGNVIVKTEKPGCKRVRLPSVDIPMFIIENDRPQFLDNSKVGLQSTGNISNNPTVLKVGDKEPPKLGILKHSESLVSLYSINFDDFNEDPSDGDEIMSDEKLRMMRKIHHVIIDCSPITYIDASGTNVLCHIHTEYSHVNIKFFLAGCSAYVRRIMKQAGVFDKIPLNHFFVDVHDAVSFAKPQRALPIKPEHLEDFSDEEAIEGSHLVNA